MDMHKGRRVLVPVTSSQPAKVETQSVERRAFADIDFRERAGIERQAKRDDRIADAALVEQYLARKGKAIIKCKAHEPKGQFLGTFGKKRVYSPVLPGSLNERKSKAITTQQFSRGWQIGFKSNIDRGVNVYTPIKVKEQYAVYQKPLMFLDSNIKVGFSE